MMQATQIGDLSIAFELAAILLTISFVLFLVIRKIQERV